jgi:hypothetical protein
MFLKKKQAFLRHLLLNKVLLLSNAAVDVFFDVKVIANLFKKPFNKSILNYEIIRFLLTS